MIADLEKKIRSARAAYYEAGSSDIEDAEYDLLEDQLRSIDPRNSLLNEVGSAENVLNKVAHSIPMGSLNKAMNRSELAAFAGKHQVEYCVSYKMDGGSVSLEYLNGKLVSAITRGDGVHGEDITHNALKFNIPVKNVKIDGAAFTGFVRGEIILSNDNWKEADPDLTSNPRNLAIGISKRKSDSSEAHLITVYAFSAYRSNGLKIAQTESEIFKKLAETGFHIPEYRVLKSLTDVWDFVTEVENRRKNLDFWIDGIVVSCNDVQYQDTFAVERKPEWSIAVKFSPRTYLTKLIDVSLQVGHTGKIVPVGRFQPVMIDGTQVSSALLCNWNVISALDIAIGDTVEIYKAGDIIPRVLRVVSRPDDRVIIDEPKVCPICGSPVERKTNLSGLDSADFYCTNDDCESKQFGKIKRFIHSMDIKELGSSIVKALIRDGIVTDISDLYALTESIESVETSSGKRIGKTVARKIVKNISDKKTFTIPQLLGSIGIFNLGKGRVENIMEAAPCHFNKLEDFFKGKLSSKAIAAEAGVPGLGAQIQESLNKKKDLVYRILSYSGIEVTLPVKKKSDAKTFSVTGTLSRGRKEIAKDIETAGHVFDGGVGAGLDYLVMEDPTSSSNKAEKARKLGIKCISEAELYEILKA